MTLVASLDLEYLFTFNFGSPHIKVRVTLTDNLLKSDVKKSFQYIESKELVEIRNYGFLFNDSKMSNNYSVMRSAFWYFFKTSSFFRCFHPEFTVALSFHVKEVVVPLISISPKQECTPLDFKVENKFQRLRKLIQNWLVNYMKIKIFFRNFERV